MLKLTLILLLYFNCQFNCESHNVNHDGNNLAKLLQDKIIDFKSRLHRILEVKQLEAITSVQRVKRSTESTRVNKNLVTIDKIVSVQDNVQPNETITCWTINSNGLLHWSTYPLSINTGRIAYLHHNQRPNESPLLVREGQTLDHDLGSDSVIFKMKLFKDQQFMLAGLSRYKGSASYQLVVFKVKREKLARVFNQVIGHKFEFDLAELNGTVYLVVAGLREDNDSHNSYPNEIRLYKWHETQFDMEEQKFVQEQIESIAFVATPTSLHIVAGRKNSSVLAVTGDEKNGKKKMIKKWLLSEVEATKVVTFAIGSHNYVLFTGPNGASLSWISSAYLIPYPEFKSSKGSIDAAVITFGPHALIALLFDGYILFYSHSLNADEPYTVTYNLSLPTVGGARPKGFDMFYNYLDKSAFILLDYHPSTRDAYGKPTYVIKLSLKTLLPKTEHPLKDCLEKLGNTLAERSQIVEEMHERINKIWVTNQPQTVLTPVVVGHSLRVQSKLVARAIHITSFRNDFNLTKHGVENKLNDSKRRASSIESTVEHEVVRKNRPSQEIKGTIHFLRPVNVRKATIDNINSSVVINGVPLKDLKDKVLRKSGNQTITGRWQFRNTVFVKDLQANGRVSGVNLADALLRDSSTEQVIRGKIQVRNATFKSSLSFEAINGIKKENLVLARGNGGQVQTITGNKQFRSITSTGNIQLTGLLNGRNWKDLIQRSINISNPQSILFSNLKFMIPPVVNKLHARFVNNASIDYIIREGVTPEELSSISGRKTFQNLHASNILLDGRLNGLNPSTDLVTLNTNQSIPATITFVGNVTFDSDLSVGLLNGIDITQDVVLRRSAQPQIIVGHKIFNHSIHVENTFPRYNTIDGDINLSTIERAMNDSANLEAEEEISYDGKLTINGSLEVEFINGYRIQDLPIVLFSKSRDQVISWPTKFQGKLIIDKAYAPLVNNLHVPDDLVLKDSQEEQTITGKKHFSQVNLVKGSLTLGKEGTFNGQKFESLNQAIIKNEPSESKICIGKKSFSSVIVHGNIIAERVNGLVLDRDVMLVDRPQNITGRKYFADGIRIRDTIMFSDVDIKTLNGINVSETLSQMIRYDQQEITLFNKDFQSGLYAEELEIHGRINDVKINDFLNQVVRLDKPQNILSSLKFVDNVTFLHPIDARSINSIDLRSHFQNLISRGQPANITGKMIVHGDVSIRGNLLVKRLNHGDPKYLKNFVLASDSDNKFSRKVIFNSPVHIKNLHIADSATIHGINPRDLVRTDKPMEIKGSVVIDGNVRINRELIVKSGLINNCDLKNIWSQHHGSSDPLVFNEPVDFTSLNILGNLRVAGNKINNVDIDGLASKVIKLADHQRFNSTMVFDDDVYVDELVISGLVNGIDLNHIYRDSVKKSALNERVTAPKTFTKSVTVQDGSMIFSNQVNIKGLVNSYNLTQLSRNIVTTGGNHIVHGRKIFYSNQPIAFKDIETSTIGNVSLEDLVLVAQDGDIPYNTTFRDNVVINNMETSNNPWQRAELFSTNRTMVEFVDPVSINHLKVKFINGIPIQSFVTKNGNHILTGSYRFTKRVYIQGNLMMDTRSRINNIDLYDLNQRAVDIRKSADIPGRVSFVGEVKFLKGLELNVSNTGLNKIELNYELRDLTQNFEEKLSEMERKIDLHKKTLSHYQQLLATQSLKFDYFELHTSLYDFDLGEKPYNIERVLVSRTLFDYGTSSNISQPKTSLYLWLVDPQDSCKRTTFGFDVYPNSTLKEKRIVMPKGRTFPITSYLFNGSVSQIWAWSNSTSLSCAQESYGKRSGSHHESYIYTKSLSLMKRTSYSGEINGGPVIIDGYKLFQDIQYFSDGQQLYAIVLHSYDAQKRTTSTNSVLYRCASLGCKKVQDIPTNGAISMDINQHSFNNITILAILNRPLDCNLNPYVTLFIWNSYTKRFVQHGPAIPVSSPSEVSLLRVKNNDQLFLIVANSMGARSDCERSNNLNYAGKSYSSVDVYYVDPSRNQSAIKSVQSLNYDVNTMSHFDVGPETYLVLGSKLSGRTYILRFEGINMFNRIAEHVTKGVTDVESYWVSSKELFLIIASKYPMECKILKAYLSGGNI